MALLLDLRTVLSIMPADMDSAIRLAEELNIEREVHSPPLPPLRVSCISQAPEELLQAGVLDGLVQP